MADNYNIGQGLYQAIGGLHDLASTGLVSAQAQQAQMALEQQRQAAEVTRNYLARQGQPQAPQPQQAPQQPYGMVSPQAFGPDQGLAQLGSPGGQGTPIQQVQPQAQPLSQTGQQPPKMTDFMDGLSQEYMKAGLVEKASELATHSADLKHKANLASSEAAQTKVRELEAQEKHIEQIGRYAASSLEATGGKETFASRELARQMMVRDHPELENDPDFPKVIPPGQLEFWAKNAMSVKDRVVQQREQLVANSTIAKNTQQIELEKSAVDFNKSRTEKTQLEASNLKKVDGLTKLSIDKQNEADKYRQDGKEAEASLAQHEADVAQQQAEQIRGKSALGARGAATVQLANRRVLNALTGVASTMDAVMALPSGTTGGPISFMTKPDGVISYLKNNAMTKLSKSDADALNTAFTGLSLNLTAIDMAGVATGMATAAGQFEKNIKFNQGETRQGVAFKIADIRRIAEELVQAQIDSGELRGGQAEVAKKQLARLRKAIPFTLTDVSDVIRGDKKTLGEEMTGVVGKGQQSSKQADEHHDTLPDAAKYEGKIATDNNTGETFKSVNGQWVKQ